MSTSRHHNEWLSLLEVSGPFLSLPVLLRVFPQGLDALDKAQSAEARLAYEEWAENQSGLRPEPAIHSVWVRYVLERLLGFEKGNLLEGPAIPAHLKATFAEHGETIRPHLVVSPGNGSAKLLVAVYPFGQKLESPLRDHRWKASPAMRMMELLRATGVQIGLLTNGEQWMLVNAPRGETSSFISWYASLWFEEPLTQRAFTSFLGARRFFGVADEDTLEAMLRASVDQQQEVTDQLGYQVRRAVEVLTRALDKADQDQGRILLKGIHESDLYEAALTVMMRLVFLFSAEERGLLLLGDPIYDQNYAVSTLRAQLRETADQLGEEVLERRFDAWCRLTAAFRAVHEGIQHDRMHLPAYGGSLFDPDRYPFLEGRESPDLTPDSSPDRRGESEPLPISNRTVLHLLDSLQILRVKVPGGGPAEARRLSFRALDVEQIGHVYEGLLDHIAVRAGETVLGLSGTRDKEPEIPLSVLEAERQKGSASFADFLKEQTGRSTNALKRALQAEIDAFSANQLKIACNNNETVYQHVLPYAGLLRQDDFGYPTVFLANSVYITTGATRRATGTHYTPRSLTEPIVQHTLEPLVYIGPAEGLPKEQWKLRSPADLLELNVCDMAMGSAGFLVQVIRYLSERLVEAWEAVIVSQAEKGQGAGISLQITPEGKLATGTPSETIIPRDDEERMVLARRLVADRCIYGVDKNPLAVEIAKLSIWLTTMDKGRPFTFLDHALKCGDSLVGTGAEDYLRWARGWQAAEATLFDAQLQEQLEIARQKRRQLEAFQVLDVHDIDRKAQLLSDADSALARVKIGCDLLVGARLLGLSSKEAEELQLNLLFSYMAGKENENQDAQRALAAARQVRAFHWEFEFPEVFEKGGFSAFVGNPPFMRGKSISTNLGDEYLLILKLLWNHQSGSADYCTYFFLRGFEYLDNRGTMGLIATNTIAQGDTREVGLDYIIREGGKIYNATTNMQWPGIAAVVVSVVHITKGLVKLPSVINDTPAVHISSFLTNQELHKKPFPLAHNDGKGHMGTNVLSLGFMLTADDAKELIERNSKNAEVLFQYLIGKDLYTSPTQTPSRWIINFFDWPLEKAKLYPDCFELIERSVYPERVDKKGSYATRWWQYARRQEKLYEAIVSLKRVLVKTQVSSTWAFCFVPANMVYDQRLVVIATDIYNDFSILQSEIHWTWAQVFSATLKRDMSYTSSVTFHTYPFPLDIWDRLETIGASYHEIRSQIMLSHQEGLTAIYNRLHNPKEKTSDIARLRELQVEMDYAVAAAYGWSDLELGHGFHETPQGLRYTISEPARREVLKRLLELNHERYEEEVKAGLHEKKGKKASPAKTSSSKKKAARPAQPARASQLNLLGEIDPTPQQEPPFEVPQASATPSEPIGDWDQCVCLECGKHLVGFMLKEHTREKHNGVVPSYRKLGG